MTPPEWALAKAKALYRPLLLDTFPWLEEDAAMKAIHDANTQIVGMRAAVARALAEIADAADRAGFERGARKQRGLLVGLAAYVAPEEG